jgi:hypothetical protein
MRSLPHRREEKQRLPPGLPILWALLTGPVVTVVLVVTGSAWWTMLAYHVGCALAARAAGSGLGPRTDGIALIGLGVFSAGLTVAALAIVWPLLRSLLAIVWGNWGLRRGQDLPLLIWYVLGQGACPRHSGLPPLSLRRARARVRAWSRLRARVGGPPGKRLLDGDAVALRQRLVGGREPPRCGSGARPRLLDADAPTYGLTPGFDGSRAFSNRGSALEASALTGKRAPTGEPSFRVPCRPQLPVQIFHRGPGRVARGT